MIKNTVCVISFMNRHEIHFIVILNRIICIENQLLEMRFI